MNRFCLLLIFSLLPTSALAHDITLRGEILTDIPLQWGVAAIGEGPFGLRLRTSVGYIPAPYVAMVNAVVQAVDDSYSDEIASLVESALQKSIIWRTHVGWRPSAEHGFYFHLGYSLVTLGGGATGMNLLETLTHVDVPDTAESRSGKLTFTADSSLHMLDIELGWEWNLWEGLMLRAGLGWSYTVASATDIEPNFAVPRAIAAQVNELENVGESFLNDTYQTYVHPPTLVLAVGWRLF